MELTQAYARRQQWLAKLQAAEVINALGTALGGKGSTGRTNSGKPIRETNLEGFMAEMDAKWQ